MKSLTSWISQRPHKAKQVLTEKQLNKVLREVHAMSKGRSLLPMEAKIAPFVKKKSAANPKPIGVVHYYKSGVFFGADVSQSKKRRRK